MFFRFPTSFRFSTRAFLLCLFIVACSDGSEPGTTASESGAASSEPGEGLATSGRTHWTNDQPIGLGMGGVDAAMLESGLEDPTKWLLYGGNYGNYRHSPIEELTPAAVPNLKVAWSFPTGTDRQFEVSPVVYDGIMYISSSYNRLFALDAATGEPFWRYDHQLPDDRLVCCGPVNRGVAITGDAVLMATLDARLIAFHRLSGEILWDTEIIDYREGYAATGAPLVVGDKAIIGIAGGEYGIRGFFDAYDVATGERVWRHYTVPAAGGTPAPMTRRPIPCSGQPEIRPLIGTVTSGKATISTPTRLSPSIPTLASGSGTSSSRPTTSGTTMATRRYSWSI